MISQPKTIMIHSHTMLLGAGAENNGQSTQHNDHVMSQHLTSLTQATDAEERSRGSECMLCVCLTWHGVGTVETGSPDWLLH